MVFSVIESPLQREAQPELLATKLIIQRGKAKPRPKQTAWKVRADKKLKILVISRMRMRTGAGRCY